MAIKNIDLNIKRPGIDGIGDKIVFTKVASADDFFRIPRRYPFADIANYDALKTAGFFRHTTKLVSDKLGSNTADTEGGIGYELPNTEKLILLAKKGATTAETITIKGSTEYVIGDITVTLPAGAVGDLYEIDLYNFGLYIAGVSGESGISIKVTHPTVELALVARMG